MLAIADVAPPVVRTAAGARHEGRTPDRARSPVVETAAKGAGARRGDRSPHTFPCLPLPPVIDSRPCCNIFLTIPVGRLSRPVPWVDSGGESTKNCGTTLSQPSLQNSLTNQSFLHSGRQGKVVPPNTYSNFKRAVHSCTAADAAAVEQAPTTTLICRARPHVQS